MRKIWLLLSMMIFGVVSYAVNFSVAPTRFEINLDKVATNEVFILNNTPKPLRIETYLESDRDFGEEYNLNSNIAVFPKIIAIKPGGKQIVRFRVKNSKELENGEYKSYIVFREAQGEIKTTDQAPKGDKVQTELSILTEIGISIYAQVGQEELKGELKNFKVAYKNKVLSMAGEAISEGNTSFKFRYRIEDNRGEVLSEGRLGNSKRVGKNPVGVSLVKLPNLAGKEILVKITDQKDNVHYEKRIKF